MTSPANADTSSSAVGEAPSAHGRVPAHVLNPSNPGKEPNER